MNSYEKEVNDIYSDSISIHLRTMMDNLWRCIVKYWILFIVLIIGGAGIFFLLFEHFNKVEYESDHIYCITKTGDTEQDILMTSYLGSAFSEMIEFGGCGNEIANMLEYDSYDELPVTITGAAINGANMVRVQITGEDSKLIQKVSDAFDKIYPKYANRIVGTVGVENIHLTEKDVAGRQILNKTVMIVVGAAVGALIDLIIVFILVLSQNKVYSKDVAMQEQGVNCLAEFPILRQKKRSKKKDCFSGNSQELQVFREAMNAFCIKLRRKFYQDSVFMITSTQSGEGKSSITKEMAQTFSQMQKKVMIIQMDEKKDEQSRGVLSLFEENLKIEDVMETIGKNIFLMKKGKSGSGNTVLTKKNIGKLIDQLKQEYGFDYILIDTPAILSSMDALILKDYVDQTIYVIAQGRVSYNDLKKGIDSLNTDSHPLAGFVMNYSEAGISGGGRYGKYGYGKYGYRRYGQQR
ncbi:Tyrosine-protein kinase CpsD [Clostridiales bacterium CHKCI001]|nr:Tyrosine-protein kinase CpsD [Clostridiales bacterium CHKCI001]